MTTQRLALIAAGLLLAAPRPSVGQTTARTTRTGPTSMPRDVLAAQQFVLDAYPDLLSRSVTIHLRPSDGQILVSVGDTQPGADGKTAPAPPPLVTAIVEFDGAGQLRRYQASGALLEKTRNDLLRNQQVAHPDWSDGQLDDWLGAAGGASTRGAPPAPAAAAVGPTQRWRSFLGTDANAAAPAFRWKADGNRTAASATDAPAWLVDATATGSKGEVLHYQLAYEPFSGRLIAAVRQ